MWHSFREYSGTRAPILRAAARFTLLLAALLASLSTLTGFAQPVFPEISSRSDALAALEHADPRDRASAITYLGRTGLAADGPLLVRHLNDRNPQVRELAERNVWMVWSHSGDPGVDRMLVEGTTLMQAGRLQQAIEVFGKVIRRKPEFAEAWNKRATAYFFAGDLRKSLADCDQVLKRNPLHFGALAGYGQIYLQMEEYEKSLDYFRRALKLNPNLQGVDAAIQHIEALVRERRSKFI